MRARLVADPADFIDRAGPLLLADEARHNLILGLAATLRDHPSVYPEHRLWLVEQDGEVVGARSGGLLGGLPEAEEFAALWAARTGARPEVAFAQGIYALEEVREVGTAPGRARLVTNVDLSLLHDWWRAFAVEALGEHGPDPDDIARAVAHRLDDGGGGGFLLWEDGEVVSLAGFGSPTPNGVRIGPVYTPLTQRGRGYATALVAALRPSASPQAAGSASSTPISRTRPRTRPTSRSATSWSANRPRSGSFQPRSEARAGCCRACVAASRSAWSASARGPR